ncbi:hypothetical protein AC1031_018520 [Aphanomyces cochlioides]|nr:hypothetical protein AC1031_018520 [Aphanomyces cochlioides]
MDFPPNLPSFNTFNVQRPVDNLRVEHDNVIDKLVQKAEALKRAMEKALDVQENRPSNDIQTILATAKSFGPVDTVDSVAQIYPRKMLETESSPQITEMPRSSPPPVYATEAVKRIPLEMLLCVDSLDAIKLKVSNAKSSANVYIQHKALFTTTSLLSPWKKVSVFTRKVPFTYSISQPFELNGSTLVYLKTKQMILEVWMKLSTESHLVGLAKLRLSCFAHLLHNKAISDIQAGDNPFASKFYDNVVIKNPFDGSTMGLMACSIWIGDATQIRTIQLKQFEARRIQAWWRGCNARRNPLPHCRKDDLKFTEQAQQVDLDTINNIEAERDSCNKPTDQDASKRNELKVDGHQRKYFRSDDDAARKIQGAFRRFKEQLDSTDWMNAQPQVQHDENIEEQLIIDQETIDILNQPVLQQGFPKDIKPGDYYYRVALEITQPCPISGGMEIRYSLHGTMSSLWWDTYSPALSSRNEHVLVDTASSTLLNLEIWSPHDSFLGSAVLNMPHFAVQELSVPIKWARQDYHDVEFLPLRVHHSKEILNAKHDSTAKISKPLPATATICVEISSLDIFTDTSDWNVFLTFSIVIGNELHPLSKTAEYNTEYHQYISYKSSPHFLLESPMTSVKIEEHVVIHPALLESMQTNEMTIQVYHYVMNMDILIGKASIPLATLLYRKRGIHGIFPLDQGALYPGRMEVHIFFLHNHDPLIENDIVLPESTPSNERRVPNRQSDQTFSIHDYDFLLDESLDKFDHQNVGNADSIVRTENMQTSKEKYLDELTSSSDLQDGDVHQSTVIRIEEARNLGMLDGKPPNVSATFFWEGKEYNTPVCFGSTCPEWSYENYFRTEFHEKEFKVSIYHHDTITDSTIPIGQATVDMSILKWTKEICGWYHILDKQNTSNGQLKISIGPTSKHDLSTSNDDKVQDDSLSLHELRDLVQSLKVMDASLKQVVPFQHGSQVYSDIMESKEYDSIPNVPDIASHESDHHQTSCQNSLEVPHSRDEEVHEDETRTAPIQSTGGQNPNQVMIVDESPNETSESWDDEFLDMNALNIHGSPIDEPFDFSNDENTDDEVGRRMISGTLNNGRTDYDIDSATSLKEPNDFHAECDEMVIDDAKNSETLKSNHSSEHLLDLDVESTFLGVQGHLAFDDHTKLVDMNVPEIVSSRFSLDNESNYGLDAASLSSLSRVSEGSVKLDIRELEVFAPQQPSRSEINASFPTTPLTSSLGKAQEVLLLQVLEAMEDMKTEIAALVKKNEEIAHQLSEMPSLVADSCSASRVSTCQTDTIDFGTIKSNDVPSPESPRKNDASSPPNLSQEKENDKACVEPLQESVSKETQTISSSTATKSTATSPSLTTSSTLPSDSTVNYIEEIVESASTQNQIQSTNLPDSTPPIFGSYWSDFAHSPRLRESTSHLTIPSLVCAPNTYSQRLEHVNDFASHSGRHWSRETPLEHLPRVFRSTNKIDAEPKPASRPLFDSETERIARIMSGNLEQWMENDSSDEECL